jgi:putative transcriptional regulator
VDNDSIIYNRIAVLRSERKISRRELANALDVHYQTIGYLERGEFNPSLHLALRIAQYFEVPVETLFSLSEFERIQ